jgi:hypothetical protein
MSDAPPKFVMSLPKAKRVQHIDEQGNETYVTDDRWAFLRAADPTLKVFHSPASQSSLKRTGYSWSYLVAIAGILFPVTNVGAVLGLQSSQPAQRPKTCADEVPAILHVATVTG